MKKFDQYSVVKIGNIQQTLQEYIYINNYTPNNFTGLK